MESINGAAATMHGRPFVRYNVKLYLRTIFIMYKEYSFGVLVLRCSTKYAAGFLLWLVPPDN